MVYVTVRNMNSLQEAPKRKYPKYSFGKDFLASGVTSVAAIIGTHALADTVRPLFVKD